MNKPDIKRIYVDLDGVLADFRKRYIELFGTDPLDSHKHKKMRDNWEKFVEDGEFANLDLMPDCKPGLEFLKKLKDIEVFILSSTANEEQFKTISKDKREWLEKMGIDFPAIFVPGKKHKKEYAEKNALLIDDTHSTIEKWNEEGGVGIYHTDWQTTLTILKMYI